MVATKTICHILDVAGDQVPVMEITANGKKRRKMLEAKCLWYDSDGTLRPEPELLIHAKRLLKAATAKGDGCREAVMPPIQVLTATGLDGDRAQEIVERFTAFGFIRPRGKKIIINPPRS